MMIDGLNGSMIEGILAPYKQLLTSEYTLRRPYSKMRQPTKNLPTENCLERRVGLGHILAVGITQT